MPDPSIVLFGYVSGLSLLVMVGPQSLFVLRQGLLGRHVTAVCATVILCDVILLSVGARGMAGLSNRIAGMEGVLTLGGSLFVAGFGLLALSRAFQPRLVPAGAGDPALSPPALGGALQTVTAALGVTLLNPLVYFETIVFLGSLATTSGAPMTFVGGAVAASVTVFLGLGYGAAIVRPLLDTPRSWQILDMGAGSLMLVLAATMWASLL